MFNRVLLVWVLLLSAIGIARAAPPATLPAIGHVTSSDGKPIAGATVWVWNAVQYQKPRILLKTTSKADGSFDVPAVPKDEVTAVRVIARADGYALGGSSDKVDIALTVTTSTKVKFEAPGGKPATGVKVAPALIISMGHDVRRSWHVEIPEELRLEFAVAADGDGVVNFPYLPPAGRVIVRALDDAYAQCDLRESLILRTGGETPIKTIRLLPAGVIDGQVVDTSGKPAAGVCVSAQGVDAGTGGTTYTDADGRYAIKQMRPGVFNVALGLRGEMSESWTAVAYEKLALDAGQKLAAKDFKLIAGTLITGMVMDDTDTPVGGMWIGVYGPAHPKSGAWVQTALSAPDGTYRLRVPAGEQYVYFYSSPPDGYLKPRQASTTVTTTDAKGAVVDFILPRDSNPPIKGKAIDSAGKPVAGAAVTLETPPRKGEMQYGPRSVKTTDGDGRFEFAAVPTGSKLRAAKDKAGTLKPYMVKANDDDVTLTMDQGYLTTVTGAVVDENGKPIATAKVSLTRMVGDWGEGSPPISVDAKGRYQLTDLPVDGQYSVSAFAKGFGEAQAAVKLKPGDVNEAPALKLARATSFVAGKVVDVKGQPIAGAKVYLMASRGERLEVTTDADGAFRFDSIVAGKTVTVFTMSANGRTMAGSERVKADTSDAVVKHFEKP